MSAVVNIARCPEHGLHGERTECFVCGGPVEQVPMVPASDRPAAWYHEPLELALLLSYLRAADDPRVRSVDGVISLLHRPWTCNTEHAEMRAAMAAAQADAA